MRILSNAQCAQWLSSHSFDFIADNRQTATEGHVRFPAFGCTNEFRMPVSLDARTQILLSRSLSQWIQGSEILLWVTSWALCTPEEMECVLDFRRKFGERRDLIDAPGFFFKGGDAKDVCNIATLLLLMMAFNWEGFVLRSDKQSIIWMADEILDVYSCEQRKNRELIVTLQNLDIDKLP